MIYNTEAILQDLNKKIAKRRPWSLVRLGDAGTGIVSAFAAPGIVDRGKWQGSRGKKLANSLLGQLTVPMVMRVKLIKRVIFSMNNANYIDHYESFYSNPTKKGVGVLGEKQDEIHAAAGINNGGNFCNPFVHYFSIVQDEYNIFDIMKDRRIFCITNQTGVIQRLSKASGAKVIHSYRIPRRGRKAGHYKFHFQKVNNLIKARAKKYDLFLVGAGFLAVVYCGMIKRHGGRAFDCGRVFDFWGNARAIDSRPKRFISYNSSTMLCQRKKSPEGVKKGVW
jgi:hypothetical protein